MLLRFYSVACVSFCLFLTSVQGQNIEDIVARHVAAIGGSETWKALQSLVIVSRAEHFSFNQYWKKPNRIRKDVPLPFPTESIDVRAFDGAVGWRINPMEGSEEPRLMSAKEIADLQEEGDWLIELVDYKAKRYRVELVGKEPVGSTAAYKLKLMKPSGAILFLFLDAKTFLELRRVRPHKTPWGEESEQVTILSDYRPVGGLMLPHRVGDAIREYDVNQPLDDIIFKMPRKQADEEKKGKGEFVVVPDFSKAEVDKDGKLSREERWALAKKDEAARHLLPVGSLAPDWTLKDAQGKPHKLSDYRGKVIVMDFWAVWCIPCHRAMPGLQKLHEDLAKRGVVVIGISTGERGGDPVQLMKDRSYTYGLLLNGETVAEAYRVKGLPTVYIIGVDGRIIQAGFGANEVAEQRRRAFLDEYLTAQKK